MCPNNATPQNHVVRDRYAHLTLLPAHLRHVTAESSTGKQPFIALTGHNELGHAHPSVRATPRAVVSHLLAAKLTVATPQPEPAATTRSFINHDVHLKPFKQCSRFSVQILRCRFVASLLQACCCRPQCFPRQWPRRAAVHVRAFQPPSHTCCCGPPRAV